MAKLENIFSRKNVFAAFLNSSRQDNNEINVSFSKLIETSKINVKDKLVFLGDDNNDTFSSADFVQGQIARTKYGGLQLRAATGVNEDFSIRSADGVIILKNPVGTRHVMLGNSANSNILMGAAGNAVSPATAELVIDSTNSVHNGLGDPTEYDLMIKFQGATSVDTGEGQGIAFAGDRTGTEVGAAIVHLNAGSNSKGSLNFYTKQSTTSGAAPAEVMRLDENGGVNIGGAAAANTKSILELTSTTKAFLPPRMTTTQRDNISSPATGSVIYNTTTNAVNYYNGTAWTAVGTGNATFSLGSETTVTASSNASGDTAGYNGGTRWVKIDSTTLGEGLYEVTSLGGRNGATVSGNVRYALANDAGGEPGQLLAETKSVAQSGTSQFQDIALGKAILITGGDYWIGMQCSSATAQFGYNAGTNFYGETQVYGYFPNVQAAASSANAPALRMKYKQRISTS